MTDSVMFEPGTLLCLGALVYALARSIRAIVSRSPRRRVAWWGLTIAMTAVGSHFLAVADYPAYSWAARIAATGMFVLFVDEQLGRTRA